MVELVAKLAEINSGSDNLAGLARVELELTALLKQLTAVISDDNTNIRHMDVRTDDHRADIDVTIDIEDVKHLDRIVSGIRKIPGILDVQRVKKI